MEADDVSTDFRAYASSTRHTTLAKYMTNVTICSNNVSGTATKTPAGCHDFYDNSSKSDDYKYLSKVGYYAKARSMMGNSCFQAER